MRATIERTASSHPRLDRFCGALEEQGITPRLAYRGGVLHGITYRAQGTEVRGSKLGKAYSFPGLQRHLGVEYRPERDDPVVEERYLRQAQQRAQGELPGAGLAAAQVVERQRQAQLPTRRRQRGVELER